MNINRKFNLLSVFNSSLVAIGLFGVHSAHAGEIDARSIGHCTWDGHEDVSACIQQAIVNASAGDTIRIPSGTWPLAKAVVLTSDVTLQGDVNKTILKPTPDNQSEPALLKIKMGAKNTTVKGIVFDGGGADFSNNKPIIAGTHVSHALFEQIVVRNARGVGVLLEGGTSDSGIQSSQFINIGNHWRNTLDRKDRLQGVIFCCGNGNSRNFANNNKFTDIGLDALQIGNQDSFVARNNVFDLSNEQFKKLKSGDYPAGIFALESRGVEITDNVIHDAPGNGIDAPGLQNSTITHNTISGSGSAGIGIFMGYDHKTQAHDVSIIRNTVTNNGHWDKASFLGGISIFGGTPDSITIADNTVTDNQSVKTQKYGIYVRKGTASTNLKIESSNQLSGNLLSPTLNENK